MLVFLRGLLLNYNPHHSTIIDSSFNWFSSNLSCYLENPLLNCWIKVGVKKIMVKLCRSRVFVFSGVPWGKNPRFSIITIIIFTIKPKTVNASLIHPFLKYLSIIPRHKNPLPMKLSIFPIPIFQEFSNKNECMIDPHPTSLHNCKHPYPPCYHKLASTVTLVHEEFHPCPQWKIHRRQYPILHDCLTRVQSIK